MQQFFLQKKNQIAFVSGFLIALAMLSKYGMQYEPLYVGGLTIASILGVIPIAIQAYQALKVKVVSIDVLVTIAVVGAFLIQNVEESAIVTFLFLFGAYLEQRTLDKTRSAIQSLVEMAPDTALKRMDDNEYEVVGIEQVNVHDVVLVKTGAKVPVDGEVIEGEGYVDESSIFGEPIPVSKEKGSLVYAGTILENGTIQVVASKVMEDTTFGRIIELVEEAQDSKSATEKFINKFSKYYTPAVLALAFIVYVGFLDLELAITVLVLGCPGALVIGVPVSNVAGIGNGAQHGVLLKGSEVISDLSRVDTIVFDKTGTLTIGKPKVDTLIVAEHALNQALDYFVSVEQQSDHPLAGAIVEYVQAEKVYPIDKTEVIKGQGIVAIVDQHEVVVGNQALLEANNIRFSKAQLDDIEQLESQGSSIVLMGMDGQCVIIVGIKDQLRPNIAHDLERLKKLGVKSLVVLSGDHQKSVDVIAKELGLTHAFGNMLPQDKSAYVSDLMDQGHVVAFVGDGINDSPSLALANIGIAMGSGTDIAIETSDVVLMNSDFKKLAHALGLSIATTNNMKQNIVLAVGVVVVLLLSVFFSDWMNMSIGMFVHEGSILVVILNGMRLLRYKLSS